MKNLKKIILMPSFLLCWSVLAVAQPLDSLLLLAIQNNPELKAIEAEYQAILTRGDQVSQLPNPQIGVGVPILRPETRLGPQMMMISASQMFPWFGTLDAKKEVVIQLSKVKYEELAAVKLELFYAIKSAYYELVFLKQKRKLYAASLANYKTLESIALAKVEAGNGSLADVFRVQTKIDAFEVNLKQLANEQYIRFAEVNNIIQEPLEQALIVCDSINYRLTNYNLDVYEAKIENHYPLIKKLDYQIEVSTRRQVVNENNNKPTIGMGLDYSLVNPRIDGDPINNGRDILVPKVMLSIPIYRKSYKSIAAEEKLTQEALQFRKENLIDQVLGRIIAYKREFDNAQLNYYLALNQSEKMASAYAILLAEYSAGGERFQDLIAVQNELIQLKLNAHLSILNMGMAKAKIERLTDY